MLRHWLRRCTSSNMATLQKVYDCLSCGAQIKLERKDNRWIRYNMDGSIHTDPKKTKQPQQQPTITTSASTAQAASSSLEGKLDALIAEVQALRLELQTLARFWD